VISISTIDVKNRTLLANNGWTQKKLADDLVISPDAVQKWISGKNNPTLETIKRLFDIFYVPIEKMVDDDYDIPEYYEIDRYLPYSQYRLPVKMRDSEHIIIDADLAGGARLHRYTDAGGNECSAIYQFREEVWWHYREHEQRMIKDWNMEHSND
jgi:transcriptional regulator with XRE-family HTH domain